ARRRPALVAAAAVTLAAVLSVALVAYAGEREREAHRRQEAEGKAQRLASLEAEGREVLLPGPAAFAADDWSGAQRTLARAVDRLGSEPELAGLAGVAEQLLGKASAQLADETARAGARTRYETFMRRYDDAVFHRTLYTGLNGATSLKA